MRSKGAIAILCAAVLAFAGCRSDGRGATTPAPEETPREFFGMVPQDQLTADDFARMAKGGVGSLRIFLPWGLIDPTPEEGDLVFADYDQTILGAAREGIDVLPFVYGSPAWVAQTLDGVECEEDCHAYAPTSEAALDAWGGFVGSVVERYGPRGTLWSEHPDVEARPIRVWQIWNEQNSPTFYQPEPDPVSYAKVLDVASQQIRRLDPDAEVVLGGMFGSPLGGEPPAYFAADFLRQLYEIEGPDGSFDGVAVHPYAAHPQKVESQVEEMHDEIVLAGDDDESVWITELGWASGGPDVPLNRGLEGQAKSLTEVYDYFLDKRLDFNIKAVFWYSWRDTEIEICEWCRDSGLFPADSFEPKPAWEAFLEFTGGT